MPTNYTNRVLTILFVLWVSLSAIYPRVPGSLFWFFNPRGEISFQDNLKPGIDMVGGTSLIYEIKQPEGAFPDPQLAENVATALKKRVDPQGVRNLIWRPQGATRLEIQMPTSRQNADAAAAQQAYLDARKALEATNVRVPSVLNDLETKTGADLEARLKLYAMDSQTRLEVLPQLSAAVQKLQQARQQQNAEAAAEARIALEPLQKQLEDTNLDVSRLEGALDAKSDIRKQQLADIQGRFKNFPARLAAIDKFQAAYDAWKPMRGKVDDVDRLKRDLAGSGVLSFHIVVTPQDPEFEPMLERLRNEGPRVKPGDVARWYPADRAGESEFEVPHEGQNYILVYTDQGRSMMNVDGRPKWGLASARRTSDDNGQRAVGFDFDAAGGTLFGQLTGNFVRTPTRVYFLAVVLNERVYTAPSLPDKPIYGSGIITSRGGYSESDQSYLINTLSAGALPAQLTDEPISEITVGPQLGADNLQAGLLSCIAGLAICGVFLISYYYLSGVVAFVAVLINLVIILGSMAALNATFTLPGVAGIVLSVAMAVDANVLIYERLREEQARGLSLKMALRNAYDRAFSAIFDGQLTTAITSVFLYWFGSEEVKGFGLTLLIGIVTSLFTALFVTRTIFGILVDKFGITDLSSLPRTFPRWNEMLTPKIDWVGKAWIAGILSWGFIAFGMVLFFIKLNAGEALDIEFSGGTSVRVAVTADSKLDREKVQAIVDAESEKRGQAFAAPRVVAMGDDGRQFEISTPTADTALVQQAVLEALGPQLDITQPSTFRLSDQPLEGAVDLAVLPIVSETTDIPGATQEDVIAHVGGVAVVLNDITPAITDPSGSLTPEQVIRSRIDQRLLQEADATRPASYDVEASADGHAAVILFSSPSYKYDPSNADAMSQWKASLAGPAWTIVKDSISNPPQLKSVTSFKAQVASEARTNTIIALTLSILGIMAYIWVRFGNFKYGTATVIACIHDGLFVLAAVGCSYYLGQIAFFENVLLVKPFRVDLTLVAAVLTVIGYSMNDTVVVFDRVRENRGKFGVLSRQVINDSVNQTLSRTLLTGGTSLGILLVMYIIGGDGIHGFTFAMLLGIIVGTYSSMVIAAPLLLIGKTDDVPVAQPQAKPQIAG
jgi:SecD/SecF fusion protein